MDEIVGLYKVMLDQPSSGKYFKHTFPHMKYYIERLKSDIRNSTYIEGKLHPLTFGWLGRSKINIRVGPRARKMHLKLTGPEGLLPIPGTTQTVVSVPK